MSLNIELFKQIKKQLRAKPARLRMDNWIRRGAPKEVITDRNNGYGEPISFTLPDCGTVGCIAGWAYLLAHPEVIKATTIERYNENVNSFASTDLGIEQRFRPFELFYVTYWPKPHATDYPNAKTQKERVKIVCKVIDIFIKQYQEAEQRHADYMSTAQEVQNES